MILQRYRFDAFSCAKPAFAGNARSPPMEAVMEHLFFLCPATGREVDSGVETEIVTLLRIREQQLRAPCPACGKWHEWPVRDAALAKAA
jgi:hypothetical protein